MEKKLKLTFCGGTGSVTGANFLLEEIVAEAPNRDIGFLIGVPAWIQLCIEMIIKKYGTI